MEEIDACAARLAACTRVNTRRLSAEGGEGWARVMDVYDGDTLTVAAEVLGPSNGAFMFNVRVAGIDACEIRSHDADKRARAFAARDRLVELLLVGAPPLPPGCARSRIQEAFESHTSLAQLRIRGTDKYGRALGDVILPATGRSIAGILLQESFATPYNGGARA